MTNRLISELLGQGGFWMINKRFAKDFGIETALMLSELVSTWDYLKFPEWFFITGDDIEKYTTLKRHRYEKAIKILIDGGFIETRVFGIPAKRHFKILANKFADYLQTDLHETSKLNTNNINPNNINNNTIVQKVDVYPFNEFWSDYDKKTSKAKTEKKWRTLSDSVKLKIKEHLPAYIKSTPDKKFRKDPMTYLNNQSWEDEIIIYSNKPEQPKMEAQAIISERKKERF